MAGGPVRVRVGQHLSMPHWPSPKTNVAYFMIHVARLKRVLAFIAMGLVES